MTEQPMEDRVLVEVTVPAPADAVWAALRDRSQLMQWFGWDTDSLGAEVDWIFFDHANPDDAAKVLYFGGMPDRYEVVAQGDQTLIRVVRSAPVTEGDWNAVYEDMTEGWISFTQQLAFLLARHIGQPRRTIYLSGEPLAEGALNGFPALGVDDIPAVGEPWTGPVGPDAALSGEVWHLGRHQGGLTVKEWGDGLLIAHTRAPDDSHPHGWTSVTLTTYGLDDAAFSALKSRWTDWWGAHFNTRAPGGGGDCAV
jgi:hypothetical protein